MVKEVFGANLKMNPVSEDSSISSEKMLVDLINDYSANGVVSTPEREVVVFVNSMFLENSEGFLDLMKAKGYKLGAQDISEHDSGAHTKEDSPIWLKGRGVTDVVIGHSEVRADYEKPLYAAISEFSDILFENVQIGHTGRDETDSEKSLYGSLNQSVKILNDSHMNFLNTSLKYINQKFNRKIKNALEHDLRATYCIGELFGEKNAKKTKEVLKRQLNEGLAGLNSDDLSKVIIAYEPRWAIGSDRTPTNDEIKETHDYIREVVKEMGHKDVDNLIIQYGGSMKKANVKGIMAIKGTNDKKTVNGGLIGGAALKGETFAPVVNYQK